MTPAPLKALGVKQLILDDDPYRTSAKLEQRLGHGSLSLVQSSNCLRTAVIEKASELRKEHYGNGRSENLLRVRLT